MDQMDLTGIYRTLFHPNITKHTFFLGDHKNFTKLDHVLGHKTSLSKYRKDAIIPFIPSNHNGTD